MIGMGLYPRWGPRAVVFGMHAPVNTKLDCLSAVIADTLKLWRRHHLTYDQTRYVVKEVQRALAIARPPTRQRVIARLSRAEEERLIAQAYRMPGVRSVLMKTLFQAGARVSELVHLQVVDVFLTSRCC
jgi:integrase/recombinase XerD